LTGNAGTVAGANFLGTTDNQPLKFQANGKPALILDGTTDSNQPNVIAGSISNSVQSNTYAAAIGGGARNKIGTNAPYAVIPGGYSNFVSGEFSMAAGQQAEATNNGAFVWADSQNLPFASTNNDSFNIRSQGGVFIYANGGGTAGVQLASGATAWTTLSDRNAKKNFQPVDTIGIVNKLAGIPIQLWNYKWEKDGDVPHIGPMAQDFKGAFYPGRNDKGITTLEFDGVELAAIQGLNQKLEAETKAKDEKIEALEKEIAELKTIGQQTDAKWETRFQKLEQTVAAQNSKPRSLVVYNPAQNSDKGSR